MAECFLSRAEIIEKAGVTEKQLEDLESAGVFCPSGKTVSGTSVYDQDNLDELPKISALLEVGYSFSEIRKIRKKVGIPNGSKKKGQRKVSFLTVGELADKANLSARTIKYWEEKGIFKAQTRSEGGFRLYPQEYILFCKLIKDLQNFGFSLEEIRDVSDIIRDFFVISYHSKEYLQPESFPKLERMKQKIKILKVRIDELKSGIKRWEQYISEKGKEIDRLAAKLNKAKQKDRKNKHKESKIVIKEAEIIPETAGDVSP